jgi:glycosyltransferase involved in cell wall biosynthesis
MSFAIEDERGCRSRMAAPGSVEIREAPLQRTPPRSVKKRVAIFISADSFEHFFGGMFDIDRKTYVRSYRNDFVWDYGRGLRDQGHEIFVYILSYGHAELSQAEDHLRVRFISLPAWLRPLDALLYRLRSLPGFDAARERLRFVAYGPSLHQALDVDKIDVLYHQEIWTSRFTVIARKIKIPVIGADHGAVAGQTSTFGQRQAFQSAAAVSCQSVEGLKRALSEGGNAVLMCNGVDTSFFAPSSSGGPRLKQVLTVGRIVEAQKRFSDLMRAMCLLPEFTLTIVGSGPDETKLKQLPAELGIADRVHFAGFISDRELLRRLYQRCGTFVSSSAWEAAALVVLEAMSCGAPVVATRIPSFEDLLTDGKNGLLIPVGQPEEIARAIRRAYQLQRSLGRQARETIVSHYSSKVLYKNLSDLIEKTGSGA